MKVSALYLALFAATLHAGTSQAADDEEAPLPPAEPTQDALESAPDVLEGGRTEQVRSERGASMPAAGRDAVVLEAHPDAPRWMEPKLALHGFVSPGFLISTHNNYLASSERGSFEFFEAALNATVQLDERLRAGLQIFARDLGERGNFRPTLDWAYADYRHDNWLGLRVGRLKTPFGLYNEFTDVDAGRTAILPPQSIYPLASRSFLVAVTGASVYGRVYPGPLGSVEYAGYVGTGLLEEEASASTVTDVKIIAGGRLLWSPFEGLRLGGSLLYTDLAIAFTPSRAVEEGLRMAGALPDDFAGVVDIDFDAVRLWVASLEYEHAGWLIAAEYSRWQYTLASSIPAIIPPGGDQVDNERFYAMLVFRGLDSIQMGTYLSAVFPDAKDRGGRSDRFAKPSAARQLDWALTLRWDVSANWLWKLEGHFIDGTADLSAAENPEGLKDRWGLFLVKTTVAF